MGGFGRWLRVGMVAAVAAGGCAFGKRPYTDDPLLHTGQAVWGDGERARQPEPPPPEPAPGVVIAPEPPLAPSPFWGEPPVVPMRLPLQPGKARSATKPAWGAKLPRSLDLLTNDVVFQAQIAQFLLPGPW
jgi:hypothetical protein